MELFLTLFGAIGTFASLYNFMAGKLKSDHKIFKKQLRKNIEAVCEIVRDGLNQSHELRNLIPRSAGEVIYKEVIDALANQKQVDIGKIQKQLEISRNDIFEQLIKLIDAELQKSFEYWLRQETGEIKSSLSDVKSDTSETLEIVKKLLEQDRSPVFRFITNRAPLPGKFRHRDDTVNKLCEIIRQDGKLALINGLGGIGKTSVARALYHELKDDFSYIAWVEFQDSIKESLLNSFKIFDDINDKESRYRKIEEFLGHATADTIIFIDNVSEDDDGIRFMESLSAKVVLTSRLDKLGEFEVFPIGFLSEEQCVNIFYEYYEYKKYDETQKYKDTVLELVKLVSCHTLSVELLALAANKSGYPLPTYIADLTTKGFGFPKLDVKTNQNASTQTIAEHMKKLFELVTVSEELARIVKNISLMPSIEIPAEVETWLGCDINDLKKLTKLGWLTDSETSYHMHPIVKKAIRLQYEKPQYEDCEALIDYMSGDAYIKATDIYTDVHVRLAIAEAVLEHFRGVEREEIGRLFNSIAEAYWVQGDYDKALEWLQKALKILEKVLGKEHPDTATTYNNIAAVYDEQGNYDEALELYQKALEIQEKVLEKEHPLTATTYNNIALAHKVKGDYDKALTLYQKALKILEKVLGKEHPHTATAYNNIATTYKAKGNYDEALKWHRETLEIREKVLGKEHPHTATTYNNIAAVHDAKGDYDKALTLYQKALAIFEKVLGKEHPLTVTAYNNIAAVHDAKG